MKQELNIQRNPPSFINPVRALRCQGDELLSSKGVFDREEFISLLWAFKREFPSGIVQIETSDCIVRAYKPEDLQWLFPKLP